MTKVSNNHLALTIVGTASDKSSNNQPAATETATVTGGDKSSNNQSTSDHNSSIYRQQSTSGNNQPAAFSVLANIWLVVACIGLPINFMYDVIQ